MKGHVLQVRATQTLVLDRGRAFLQQPVGRLQRVFCTGVIDGAQDVVQVRQTRSGSQRHSSLGCVRI